MSPAGTKPDRRWLDTVVDTVRVSPVTGGVARMGKKVRTLSSCELWRQWPFILLSAGLGTRSWAQQTTIRTPVGARKSVVAAELRVRQRRCRAGMIGIWLCDCSICCSAR
jgi:hypothetical protein